MRRKESHTLNERMLLFFMDNICDPRKAMHVIPFYIEVFFVSLIVHFSPILYAMHLCH